MRFIGMIRVALLVCAGMAAVAPAAGAKAVRPPVALLVLDEISTGSVMTAGGRIDPARFPNLASMARRSTWYRNNTTVADATLSAVPAILTGHRPSGSGGTGLAGHPDLFDMLHGRYRLRGYESSTTLCPRSWCPLPRSLDRLAGARLDSRSRESSHLDYVAGSLRQFKAGGRPLAWVTHALIPHVPWRFIPTGDRYSDSQVDYPSSWAYSWTDNEYGIALSQQRALLQAGFADRVVGEMRREMKKAGLWDRALVIVVGDHGGTFTAQRPRRWLSPSTFAEIAMTPLLVKYPRQRAGQVSDQSTNTTEILPTIRRWAGGSSRFAGTTLPDAGYGEAVTTRSSRDDGNQTMPLAEVLAERDGEIAQRDRRFPLSSLYRPASLGALYGRRPTGSERAYASSGSVSVDRPASFRSPRASSGSLGAAYLTAHTSGLEKGTRVAVAINGRIVAVSEVFNFAPSPHYPDGPEGRPRLATMIDPADLGRGPAHLSFYRVDGTALSRLHGG